MLSLPLGLPQHSALSKVLSRGVNKPRRCRLMRVLLGRNHRPVLALPWGTFHSEPAPEPRTNPQLHISPRFQQHSSILAPGSQEGKGHALGSIQARQSPCPWPQPICKLQEKRLCLQEKLRESCANNENSSPGAPRQLQNNQIWVQLTAGGICSSLEQQGWSCSLI